MGIDPGTNIMGYGIIKVENRKVELVNMGIIDMRKVKDTYLKLGHIFQRITSIIDSFHPDEIAIEAPFFGKNVQSMLKLGRAQGVAIAAAINRDIPIHEYMPTKIKMAITGSGGAAKQQVAGMLQRLFNINEKEMGKYLDATDALGAAYCHFMQQDRPESQASYRSWGDFVKQNKERVK